VLHQFLALVHPKHAGQAPTRASIEKSGDPWASHQEVTDMFLSLARQQYTDKGIVDPDVQVGLGTLYYMMGEYGEATDCWTAALRERPDVSCSMCQSIG
jgi:peroxin-5